MSVRFPMMIRIVFEAEGSVPSRLRFEAGDDVYQPFLHLSKLNGSQEFGEDSG